MAKKKFEITFKELRTISPKYSGIWIIDKVQFPFIRLIIKNSSGQPSIGMLLDLRNYDYLAPSIKLMDIYFRRYLNPEEIRGVLDAEGIHHIPYDHNNVLWFCEVGTFEYHVFYKEDPWELVRYSDKGNISSIVERTINLIDRSKL